MEALIAVRPLRLRFASRADPRATRRGAIHRWTSRQTTGQWAGAFRFPAGSPRSMRSEPELKQSRAEKAPAVQTRTRGPDGLDRVCSVLSSSGLYFLPISFQCLSKF